MRRRTSSVAIVSLLLVSFLSLVAIAEITAEPKITSVRIVSFRVEEEPKPVETSTALAQQARGAQRAPARGAQPPAPPPQPPQESSVTKKPPTVTFTLSIEGENLPNTDQIKEVMLLAEDPAQSVGIKEIVTADGKEVLVTAAAKAKTKINEIRIVAKDPLKTAHSTDFTIAINENPPKPKTTKFDMKLEHDKNKQFPDVHTAILTKEGGGRRTPGLKSASLSLPSSQKSSMRG